MLQGFYSFHELKAKQKSPSCFIFLPVHKQLKQFHITTTNIKYGTRISETSLTLSSAYTEFLFLSSRPDPPLQEIQRLSKTIACLSRVFTDDFSTDAD